LALFFKIYLNLKGSLDAPTIQVHGSHVDPKRSKTIPYHICDESDNRRKLIFQNNYWKTTTILNTISIYSGSSGTKHKPCLHNILNLGVSYSLCSLFLFLIVLLYPFYVESRMLTSYFSFKLKQFRRYRSNKVIIIFYPQLVPFLNHLYFRTA